MGQWASRAGLDQVLMAHAPVGPGAAAQAAAAQALTAHGIELVTFLRPFDAAAWPHADRGYFRLKKRIPELLVR